MQAADRLAQAARDIDTVLRVEGMDIELGSRRLLKEVQSAIRGAQEALAAWEAEKAQAVPGEAVLVPVEPTPQMLDAAERLDWADSDVRGNCCNLWQTMLAAWEAEKAQAVPTPELARMTAHRAAFFIDRFKKEEKLLGPNEQAALDFVLAMLAAAPQPEAAKQAERANGNA